MLVTPSDTAPSADLVEPLLPPGAPVAPEVSPKGTSYPIPGTNLPQITDEPYGARAVATGRPLTVDPHSINGADTLASIPAANRTIDPNSINAKESAAPADATATGTSASGDVPSIDEKASELHALGWLGIAGLGLLLFHAFAPRRRR